LVYIRRKWTALRIELNLEIAGIGEPRYLLAGIEHNHFRHNAHNYHLLCHWIVSSALFHVEHPATQQCAGVLEALKIAHSVVVTTG
jgi:hypothetical protein